MSQSTLVTDGQTNGQTDGITTVRPNTLSAYGDHPKSQLEDAGQPGAWQYGQCLPPTAQYAVIIREHHEVQPVTCM